MTDEEMKEALDLAKTIVELALPGSDSHSHSLHIISTALLASAAREQRMAKVVEAAREWAKYGRDDGDDEDDLLRAVRALATKEQP